VTPNGPADAKTHLDSGDRLASTAHPSGSVAAASAPAAVQPPPPIPDHELLLRIGVGSYGEVWLARNALGTLRAVKITRRAQFESDRPYEREFEGLRRFEPVSRTHPGLIQLLQIGRNDAEGYFYCVMELADDAGTERGTGNAEFTRPPAAFPASPAYVPRTLRHELKTRGRLPLDECIRLGLALTEALEHLHRQGLVHRDIKPSNIVFVNGAPKLADVGLVAAAGEPRSVVGTHGYMAPEGPGKPQADIYSLGKVLYEISTGKTRERFPEPGTELVDAPASPALRELNEVVLKACEPDPRRRYASAAELRADLVLIQSGQSVRRLRALERQTALAKRLGAGLLALLVLVGGPLLYHTAKVRRLELAVVAERERSVQSYLSEGQQHLETGDWLNSLGWFAELMNLERDRPDRAAIHRFRFEAIRRQCPALVAFGVHPGQIRSAEFSPDGRRVLTAGSDGSARLWDLAASVECVPPMRHRAGLRLAVFSPDGRTIATAGYDGVAQLWDVQSGKPLGVPLVHGSNVFSVAFDAAGRRLATASFDRTARIWDAATGGALTPPLLHPEAVTRVAFAPDGRRVATACRDGTVRLWDAASGQLAGSELRHTDHVNAVVFNPGGDALLTVSDDGTARLWDVATSTERLQPMRSETEVHFGAVSPDWERIATGGGRSGALGEARVWNARTGDLLYQLPRQSRLYATAAFSPDGQWIITGNVDGSVRLWAAKTGEPVPPVLWHSQALWSTRFAPDGRRILTASKDGTWRVWDLAGAEAGCAALELESPARAAQFNSEGNGLIVGLNTGAVIAWDPVTLASRAVVGPQGGDCRVAFSRDGRYCVVASGLIASVYDAQTGQPVSGPFRLAGRLVLAVFTPDGTRLLTAHADRTVRVWNATNGKPLTELLRHPFGITSAAFSPDGRLLATACGVEGAPTPGEARIWDAGNGRPLTPPLVHQGRVECVRFSPDGKRLLTACSPPGEGAGNARLWEAATGRPTGVTFPHGDGVGDACFSPDGRWVATASEDGTARVWEAATGRPVGHPMRHARGVMVVAFSPDGQRVATGSTDHSVRVWGSLTGEPISPPLLGDGPVADLAFSADGQKVLAACDLTETGADRRYWQGPIRLWRLLASKAPEQECLLMALILSGSRTEGTGARIPASAAELAAAWQTLKTQRPETFAVRPAAALSWHRRQGGRFFAVGDWRAAAHHLRCAVELAPGDRPLREKLRVSETRFRQASEPAADPP